jgi:hypothetical protein
MFLSIESILILKAMKNILKIVIAALLMVFATSCTKNNDTGISLSIKGITTLPAIKRSAKVEGFTFSEALLGIKEIEIKKEDESLDDGDMEFDFDGSYVVDLLAGTSTPALGFSEFLPGTYNKFESETAPVLDGGKSLSIKGTYTDLSGTVYNFEFSTNAEIEFEFESDSGFVLTEGKVLEMLVSVNLPLLFDGVDFSKATANLNGIIVINESSNASVAAAIKNNIDYVAKMEDENESEDD